MTTALLTHPACLSHTTPAGHPEQVARLERVLAALKPLALQRQAAPMAAEDDLLRLHSQQYLDGLREAQPTTGHRAMDGDTFLSPGSLEAAYRSAGAALKAVDMVLSGEVHNAFCAIRPPGHHAESEIAMGFCLLGNAALAAKYALDHHGLARVAIVDFDVHHG
ncbi:MAG: histone deacetylase family protein, partial [Paracoccaceae bacterium]|nr:histone deacetylase family protein [Paracoccaceae bacterium]